MSMRQLTHIYLLLFSVLLVGPLDGTVGFVESLIASPFCSCLLN